MLEKNFIKLLCEEQIQSTDLALSVEKMSSELQSMIEKVTKMKTDTLSTLVKKIKYNNEIEKAEGFESSIGERLDQAITALTEVKGSLDNDIVALFNGQTPGSTDEMGGDAESDIDDIADMDFDEEDDDFGLGDMESEDDLESSMKELGRRLK